MVQLRPRHPEELIRYINETPDLLSLLYDINLLPECVEEGTKEYRMMLTIAQSFFTLDADCKSTIEAMHDEMKEVLWNSSPYGFWR